MAEPQNKILVSNRKARHQYFIQDRFEAGIVLRGTEVKSLRQGNANLQDAFAEIKKGEVWLRGMHISPYEHGSISNHDPRRPRKLLLSKREIRKLHARTHEKGLTLIPLSVYIKGAYIKVELAVAQGKKTYDKRQSIARREAERDMARRMRRSHT